MGFRIADAKRYTQRMKLQKGLGDRPISELHEELTAVKLLIEALEESERFLETPEWDHILDKVLPARREMIQSERTLIAPTDVPKQGIIHGQLMENSMLTDLLFDVKGQLQQIRDRRAALAAKIEKANKAKNK